MSLLREASVCVNVSISLAFEIRLSIEDNHLVARLQRVDEILRDAAGP